MRLAYEQGLLSQLSINAFQNWALTYMLSVKRWDAGDKQQSFLKDMLFLNNPERFVQLYVPEPEAEPVLVDGKPFMQLDVDPDDFDAIDEYLRTLDKERVVEAKTLAPDEGWR